MFIFHTELKLMKFQNFQFTVMLIVYCLITVFLKRKISNAAKYAGRNEKENKKLGIFLEFWLCCNLM